MRVGFKQRPVDLYLLIVVATLCVAWSFLTSVGTPLALVLVIFSPGYMIAAAIYPGASDVRWGARIVLSVVLSIAAVSIIAVVLDYSPWGARPEIVEGVLAAFVVAVGAVAYARRNKLELGSRISLQIEVHRPTWRSLGGADRLFAIALALSVVVAAGLVAYLVTTPAPIERFTEFYLLDPAQNASNYPSNVAVSQPASIFLGVTNHEYDRTNYSIDINLVGVTTSYNTTTGQDETTPVNLTRWSHFAISLENGQTWQTRYSFQIDSIGLWEIQFLLFKGENSSATYHKLRLLVNVS